MNVTNWMGRYRGLIRELVKYENSYARFSSEKGLCLGDNIFLSSQEWQVLEYLLEHDNEINNMLSIAETLGIAPSSLSKITKKLISYELIERYRSTTNKKNIILKVTKKGDSLYRDAADTFMVPVFNILFDSLSEIPDKYLEMFVNAIHKYNNRREQSRPEEKLIKLD